MFAKACLIIGAGLFLTAVAFAVKARHNTKKIISSLLVGIFFSTLVLAMPIYKQGDNLSVLETLKAMIYSFKSLGGRQTVSEFFDAKIFTGTLKLIYDILGYIMFFTAPILSSALILTFFADFGEKMRYALHFSKKCFVISDLNETSISLARGLRASNRFATIVFCNTKNGDKELVTKAKKLGGICFYKSCVNFHVSFFHKQYEFHLVSDNEDKNIKYACEMLNKHQRIRPKKLIINAFAQSGESIDLVESLNKGNVSIRFIDKVALLCNQLIFNNPLYDIPNGSKDISVAIVGCGRTGMQMLKTVAWCGQIKDYSLKIRVYDNKAAAVEKEFFAGAPGLKSSEYDIKFIAADIFTPELEDIVTRKSRDATFLFIATGDDKLNLQTAVRLRGAYRRKQSNDGAERLDTNPKILTRVRDDIMTDNILDSKYLKDRNIVAFGNVCDLLEKKVPFETRLEKLALGVHLAYCNMSCSKKDYVKLKRAEWEKGDKEDKEGKEDKKPTKRSLARDYEETVNQFYTQEYNRRSSMATALHIASKLYNIVPNYKLLTSDGAEKPVKGEANDNGRLSIEAVAAEFDKSLDKNLEALSQNEHDRWNAFFRSEGYYGADLDTIKKHYSVQKNSHKDPLAKYHPCITAWDSLDPLMQSYYAYANPLLEKYNEEIKEYNKTVPEKEKKEEKKLYKLDKKITDSDRDIIKAIPAILRFAYLKKER